MLVILRNWNYMNILIINVIILGSYLIQVGRILCFQQVLRSADLKKTTTNYYNSMIESKRCTVDFHLFFLSLFVALENVQSELFEVKAKYEEATAAK